MTKDSQITTLKDEIAHQEDLISKLGKDKKSVSEGRQKVEEDIQSMEDRCNHPNKVKGKLEQSLDECEDALEREKKSKGDVEKLKRKVEGDLKLTQEAAADLERVNSELTQGLQRKEKELSSLGAKIEDEQTLGGKYSKQIKELQTRIDELDEEIVVERNNRAKAEKNRSLLSRDLEDLGSRLSEAGSNTSTQIELNKKHKAGMERDLQEARAGLEEAMRERANMEKKGNMTQGLIVESNQKLDEMARALNEADSTKKKL